MKKEKIVLAHGCFDVLHAGHLKHFEAARKYGDRLIVSVTTDRFVNKGPGRPYFTAARRAEMVQALKLVDEVFIVDAPTAIPAIERFKPDFYVKGQDYRDFSKDVTGEIINEKEAVERYGGKIVFTDEETHSSSKIINRFFQPWTDEQRACIDRINVLGGIDAVQKAVDEIYKIKVLVLGEPILDIYRFVRPEGISSKSPTISARFEYEETYKGGALAIGGHLESFAQKVFVHHHTRTPRKIRYIHGNQRIFEVTDIDDDPWRIANPDFFIEKMFYHSSQADVVLVADFGHGMFEGPVLESLKDLKNFIALNVQTNSSNFGYNPYHKHKRFDYLCIDTREARLGEHDRYSSPDRITARIHSKIAPRNLSVTLGSNGSALYTNNVHFKSPAFTDNVLDATGAGDAYFAITASLLYSGCNPELIPFVGNVFAGLKTKIIGNKTSVSKAQLLKACAGILK